MLSHTLKTLALLFAPLLFAASTTAHADIDGTSDPRGMPRVSGAEIIGARHAPYDIGVFMEGESPRKMTPTTIEGAYDRVLYLLPEGTAPIAALKNYEKALAELGTVEEVYRCARGCNQHLLSTNLWTRDTMVKTPEYRQTIYLLGFSHVYTNSAYRYARVVTDDARLHVGVLSATLAQNNANGSIRGRTLVLLDIVAEEDFEADLEFVDATEMVAQINDSGAVALYGIQFDTDKATLKTESDPTIAEIIAALNGNADLSLYVVGHTDNSGALAYNQDLSLRRANTVVARLTSAGIDAERLTAIGVGPVAPSATNDTDAGRALNRRVELVKR